MIQGKISAMFIYCIILEAAVLYAAAAPTSNLVIVPRSGWNARPPKEVDPMANPVPYVVIHHSYTPAACSTREECVKAMQWMQEFHQDDRHWLDIGYSFAVGGDGRAYEGRGWSRNGAHAPKYNNISIGICLIGDWSENLPPQQQLEATRKLIEFGVLEGKIAQDYELVGHRQVREGTVCPGDRLYEEIKTWPHYSTTPDYTKLVKIEKSAVDTVPPHDDNKLKKRNL